MPIPSPPPLAEALAWVSRITTVALTMVVPGIVGGWIDARLGTSWAAPAGLALGLAVGLWLLVNLTKTSEGPRRQDHG